MRWLRPVSDSSAICPAPADTGIGKHRILMARSNGRGAKPVKRYDAT
jgi:hypothetical protein